ncbi:MAG: hypothetical protein RL033_5805 [Pseudomonadota bacterium]
MLFTQLWGWALLMHHASFDKWPHSPIGWSLIGGAAALVLFPRRTELLAGTALLEFLFIQQGMPETANHLMFEGFVCFTWLFALSMQAGAARLRGVPWRKVWDGDEQGRHPLQGALLPLSAAFLMLYWLSVLHKLNYDFLDPEVSCASYMYRRVSELLPFMPHARWAEQLAIWGTLLAEAAVPALLLHRRTWRLGLVAALGFHLLLGFDPTPGIYSFTGLLYALFILLLPGTFVDTAGEQLERLRKRVGRKPLLYVRIAGLVLWISILVYSSTRHDRWSFAVGFPIFLVWALLVAGAYLYTLSRTPTVKVPTPVRTPVWLWILPALVLINGLNPYLGLRTQLSFSMFSNLRTEGGRTNHLFMPRLITLQPYEDDLVEVIEASDPILQDLRTKELLLPYFEFQAMINELDNVRVTYLRNGTEHKVSCVDWVCDDADLGTPHPRMRRAFFYFRAVDKGPKMQCRH